MPLVKHPRGMTSVDVGSGKYATTAGAGVDLLSARFMAKRFSGKVIAESEPYLRVGSMW